MRQPATATAANGHRPGCASASRPGWNVWCVSSPIFETHQTWKLGRRQNLKAACDENHGQPARFVTLTLPLPERSGSQPADSRQRDSLCCACGRLARWLPAGWRTKRCLSRSVSDEVFPPDPAPEIVTLLDGWKARKPFDNLRRPPRARGSERHAEGDVRTNQRWRAGAGVAVALAAAASMSVRRTRTRHMAFVNGNREWVARSSLLSA